MAADTYALVGLGNPGTAYAQTRHNIGFIFVDWLAAEHGAGFGANKHQSLSTRIRINDSKIHLIKPQTFMNRSGRSVASFSRYFGIDLSRLLVVHDDIDMRPGRIKLVQGGGDGGHNGIRSIVAELGSRDFFRLKIGIGRPGDGSTHPQMDVDKYVLATFPEAELEEVSSRFEEMVAGLADFFASNPGRAMTQLNALK
jgi:peptidyl-tRNA hydrolase, PTH1 family